MDSNQIARLRAHLSQSDFRKLSFVAPAVGQDLRTAVHRVGQTGCALAMVALDAPLLDRELDAGTWRANVLGAIGDGPLEPQLDRARYLGLGAVVCAIDRFDIRGCSTFASFVAARETHLWIRTSWDADGWESFDKVRRVLDHDVFVHVALDVRGSPPSSEHLERWCGEPIELLIAGDEVRSELGRLFRSVAERVLIDDPLSPVRASLETLHQQVWMNVPERERHAAGFAGGAVAPIEPLGDDLSSATYEVIESDPVKYRRYQDAIRLAVHDRADPVHVAVFGAGRGGLVDAARSACILLKRKVALTALEKNPGALETLRLRNEREWKGEVMIVDADMRYYEPPSKFDLIVSELLGGFGDNELSPECLAPVDGLLAEGGAIVPAAYASWVAPVTAAPIYMACADRERLHTVALDRAVLVAEPARCFSFVHPGPLAFEQFEQLEFDARFDAVVHGFAGFFDTTLYGDVTLSIVPGTATDKMRSWQPVFFPLVSPLSVKQGERIAVDFLRRTEGSKVWYEWCVEAPTIGRLHNAAGRGFRLRG